MKSPSTDAAPRIDGVPAVEWIAAHRHVLVDAAMAELRIDAVNDDAERAAQLRWILDYNVALFTRVFGGVASLDESSASELVASAALRAAEGFVVENLLETYVGGTAAIWRHLAAHVRPEELADLIALTGSLFEYLQGVMALVVRGYDREASRVRLGERDARYALYSALLAGADLDRASARSGLPVAHRYLVLTIRVAPEDSTGREAGHIASMRRGNALLRTLDSLAQGEVLAVIGDGRSTALIPLSDQTDADEHERVREAIDSLSAELGLPVHVGACVAVASGVSHAASQAEEILDLVLAIDQPAGAWFLEDVLLPYQLTRPSAAFDVLRDRLGVLGAHPDWLRTLQTYAKQGWDRTAAARALHVHPNTVDYRLRKMAQATGLDAGDPAQRPLVLAALYVRNTDGI